MASEASNVLVSTDWVRDNLRTPGVRLVEVDVDTKAYDVGHIPGAVGFNWSTQLQDQTTRDILTREAFEKLLGDAGISPSDTVVLYGDNNNWFAAYAFWLFKLYGHRDVRLMDGGRNKWLADDRNPLTRDTSSFTPVVYRAPSINLDLRARLPEVIEIANNTAAHSPRASTHNLVDVRSPDEFSGKVIAPPGMTETAQRGGHIPGAKNVPWAQAVAPDGTFKPRAELEQLYIRGAGVDPSKPTIAYCRIGERSSHTWFVLKYLLGIANVKNYDGSWTEYGNLVAAPIEKSV